jgi:hypothetical protein
LSAKGGGRETNHYEEDTMKRSDRWATTLSGRPGRAAGEDAIARSLGVLRLPEALPEELKIKVADSDEEFLAALELLHDAYVEEGLMRPHAQGVRVTKFHALPTTSLIVAKWRDEVVGTVTIVQDSPFGLPADNVVELGALRDGGLLVEVSSLAIQRDFRLGHGAVLMPLIAYCVRYQYRYLGAERMVITVNPAHVSFYETVFCCDRLLAPDIEQYDFVEGAPAVAMYASRDEHLARLISRYAGQPVQKNLWRLIWQLDSPNIDYPDHFFGTAPSQELFELLFDRWTDLLQHLSPREAAYLRNLRGSPYSGVYLTEPPSPQGPRTSRLPATRR